MSDSEQSPQASEPRRSPLHAEHERAGASFTDFAGWLMPVRYTSDLAEHRAVREAAGIFDISHMGEVTLAGPGAAAALDFALSTQPSTLAVDQARYSLLLDEHGGILDDLIVYRTGEEEFLVIANAGNRDVVAAELSARAAEFDAGVDDVSEAMALIAVQGPRAQEILADVGGLDAPGLAELKYYRASRGRFRGLDVFIARTGYTGEDGFELMIAPEGAIALWQAILAAGEPLGLVPAGLASRDSLRLEAGMPLYGHELGREIHPAQAGLGRVVRFDKTGDFVGRAALEAADDTASPVLVGLVLDGRRAGRAGYPVVAGDLRVGSVTSGLLSPTLGYPIAMAYVEPAAAASGTELGIDVRGTRIPATVTALPFYSRNK
ncbi:aminomethyltransferase [Paramicrobacterium humi]|uniref:Aminomethyltransferase n=1 Tax=Paramicrobacterium humi TaxID=640635 RepID=A0A1H4T3C4_9MICO|nr:glycine cleavage system aminomethyltransferase GcvT [Microbacterium humi]SEC50963.1 aminomethyltransferase [Microbacterium humi]